MENAIRSGLQEIAKGDKEDVVGLFDFYELVLEKCAPSSKEKALESLLECVSHALDMGFKVGNSPYAKDGFATWSNQDKTYAFEKITNEWYAQNEAPNLTTSVWFGLPNYDYPIS